MISEDVESLPWAEFATADAASTVLSCDLSTAV